MKYNGSDTLSSDGRTATCSVWGLNDCGQLLGSGERTVRHPISLHCSKGVFGLVAGDFHTLLVSDRLKLFAAGLNIYGQLGVSAKVLREHSTAELQEVSALAGLSIEATACGSCHSFALTTEGRVYSWGLNLKGQLGLGHFEDVQEPTLVVPLSSKATDPAKKTSTGGLKTQRQMTRNGSLLRKGTTQHIKESDESNNILMSQRSLSSEKQNFSHSMESKKSLKTETDTSDIDPSCILSLREKVVEIACGSLHTLLRTNSRRVLSSGFGGLHALGHKDSETISIFKPISYFTEHNVAVVRIACGANSSACIAQEGTAYIWGAVSYSSPDSPTVYKQPAKFPFDTAAAEGKTLPYKKAKGQYSSQKRATDVKMGDGFAVVLTERGTVYSFGVNSRGQLGVGDCRPREVAEKVKELPDNITQIACGNDHCLAVDGEYCLYAWGSNLYGQLGDDSLEEKVCEPCKVAAFDGVEVFKISCGSYSSFCLSYGVPSSQPAKQRELKGDEDFKSKVKDLEKELSKLRLELAMKSDAQVQKAPVTKMGKGNDKLNGWKPCLEIDIKDLTYVEKITEGGYGVVYLGKWRETQVAIKEIKMEYVTQDKLDEFLTECSTMEMVRHPNITLFLGACTKAPKICLVLEYCEMGSLWTLLHFTKTELPWKLRKQMALDVARSVNYLHCFPTPLLHRDLKSLNVLLDNNLTAKLADFGWARIKETVMTGRIGTYQWMAPEVIASSRYTEKADVYSFGIIMWEIAARKPPYYGIDVSEVAHRVVHQNYRPPIKDGDAPYSWIGLMKRCWQRDSSKRPSFQQIMNELNAIKEY